MFNFLVKVLKIQNRIRLFYILVKKCVGSAQVPFFCSDQVFFLSRVGSGKAWPGYATLLGIIIWPQYLYQKGKAHKKESTSTLKIKKHKTVKRIEKFFQQESLRVNNKSGF